MARIIVTPNDRPQHRILDELVLPAHLDSEHASVQLIERIAWALWDAENEPLRCSLR